MTDSETDTVREEVLRMVSLLNVSQLAQSCVNLNIQVPPAKKDRRSALFNLVLRYLTSDEVEQEDDEGLDILRTFKRQVEDMLKGNDVKDVSGTGSSAVKTEVVGSSGVTVLESSTTDGTSGAGTSGAENVTKARIELHKLREFKITGGVVGGGDNQLDYMCLSYQMKEGRAAGYSNKEVRSGVIRAMKAGSSLRRYFEGRLDLTDEQFTQILRSHYNVKDSATLLTELSNSMQESSETEMSFVLRLMGLRNTIITVSGEEGCPLDVAMVRKRFFHAVAVGLKKDTIRLELQPALKNTDMEDEDLLKEISMVVARDTEHRTKLKTGKNVATNSLNVETDEKKASEGTRCLEKGVRSKDDQILTEITKLAVKVNALAAVQTEVETLKKQMDQYDEGNKGGNGRRRRFVKCESCEKAKAFCTHCSTCGAGDHKRKECPKNV